MELVRGRLRDTTLLAAGALAVHQLRYLAAPVAAQHETALRHTYLSVAVPVAGVLVAVILAHLLTVLAGGRGRAGCRARATVGGWATVGQRPSAAVSSVALLVLYVAQESFEAVLSGGVGSLHTLLVGGAGPGLLADGGWLVIPIAVVAGALLTLGLRAGDAPLRAPPDSIPRAVWGAEPASLCQRPEAAPVLSGGLAGQLGIRGPPRTSAC